MNDLESRWPWREKKARTNSSTPACWKTRERRRCETLRSTELVTLHVGTNTQCQRKLSESYTRQCTPVGEPLDAWRMRRSAKSSARSRAMCRLQPAKQAKHLSDCKRKRDAAPKKACVAGREQRRAKKDSEWQQAEIDRQLQEAKEEGRREEARREQAKCN